MTTIFLPILQGRHEGMSWRSQNENYGAFNDSRFERTSVRRIPEYGAKDEVLERRRNKHTTTTGNYGSFYRPVSVRLRVTLYMYCLRYICLKSIVI